MESIEQEKAVGTVGLRHRRHANPLAVARRTCAPDWQNLFVRSAPWALDIGCGSGLFTEDLAIRHPEWNVVGIELRPFLVDAVNLRAERAKIKNLCGVLGCVNAEFLAALPLESVVWVSINFPDPCFKRRHHKRRVLQSSLVEALLPRLAPRACIHFMTDYLPLAKWMKKILQQYSELVSQTEQSTNGFAAVSTTDIESERERKHLKRGCAVYRGHFMKVAEPIGLIAAQ
jgi:tRNA (guanine-N7-)-methyltransferase